MLERFTARSFPRRPRPPPPACLHVSGLRRGGQPSLWAAAVRPEKKKSLGARLCPTCWGQCWSVDRADKWSESKEHRCLVCLSVGSEIRFPALPCSKLGGVCHLPCVSFLKSGGWIKVHFCLFLFIVDLVVKGMIIFKFIKGLQLKRLLVRMIDLRCDT